MTLASRDFSRTDFRLAGAAKTQAPGLLFNHASIAPAALLGGRQQEAVPGAHLPHCPDSKAILETIDHKGIGPESTAGSTMKDERFIVRLIAER